MLEIAEPKPAELLRDRDAMHAELAKLGPQIARESVAAIDLGSARRDARGRETAHALAQHVRRFPEPEIEPPETACQHGNSLLANQVPWNVGRQEARCNRRNEGRPASD